MEQSLGKSYKLCNKDQIDAIFASGQTQKQYPLVAKYDFIQKPGAPRFQIVIAAPKRTFRTAIKRNRIKRICREAVRKNKKELETWLNDNNSQLGIFLLYTGKEEVSVLKLSKKTQDLFQKIIDDLHTRYA